MGVDLESKRERWKTCLQEVQKEIWEDPPFPDYLYHYSSTKAVTNILTSREMWLSDICAARGDTDDGRYWIKVFRPIINRKSVPRYIKEVFQGNTFGLGSLWHMYLACFSPEPELDNQWRNYADSDAGCALELRFDELQSNCDGGK